MRVAVSLAWIIAALAKRDPTRCWNDGSYQPCGPGVEACGPNLPEYLLPRFHLGDPTGCGMSDPDFPFYDAVGATL